MASVFFKQVGDLYLNQAGPGPIFLLGVVQIGSSYYIQATADGATWVQDMTNVFATVTAARTALQNYVNNLNAGTA